MTMDPQAQALLNTLQAQGARDFSEMSVADARGFMAAFIDLEGSSQEVAEVIDRSVPGPGGHAIPVRIYRPQASGTRPVIVYFHGGGFVLGTLDVADKPCRQLARVTDSVVVSVDYRLAPEHRAPAAAEDAYAVTAWASREAVAFGGDGRRLAVCGDSAGGTLAAVVALMARDRGAPALKLQVLIYPIIDLDLNAEYPSRAQNGEGRLLTQRALAWFYAQYLAAPGEASKPYVSPIRATDLGRLPRAVVITAGHDPLRDEGDAYAGRLEQAGVPVLHLRNPALIHGFMWMGGVIQQTAAVYQQLGQYVREHL